MSSFWGLSDNLELILIKTARLINRNGGLCRINWNKVMKKIGMIAAAITCLQGCEKPPACSYTGFEKVEANAGCLVVNDNKLLLVEGNNGAISLPGGGTDTGEAAQCTAEREVWEETGIKVKANELVNVFDNGFHVYSCSIIDTQNQQLDGENRPFRHEVGKVHWLGVDDFENKQWRFPDQVGLMKLHLIEHRKLD